MKKSEQLKEKAKRMISCGCDECTDKRIEKGTSPIYEYRFTESELQEYASEIAREQRGADVKFFSRYLHGSDYAPNKIKNTPLVTDKP